MKKGISKLVLVSFSILLVLSVSAFKGDNNRNSKQNSKTFGDCLVNISGLSEEQKTEISALETKYKEYINSLKEQRRTSTDANKKDEIRTQMLDSKAAHQLAVKALLTDKQKAEFDQLQANKSGASKKFANKGNCKGNGVNKNKGSGKGKCKSTGSCKKL